MACDRPAHDGAGRSCTAGRSGDGTAGVIRTLTFVDPDLLFTQTTVKALDEAITFGMMTRPTEVFNAEGRNYFHETGRPRDCVLCRRSRQARSPALEKTVLDGSIQGAECVLGSATGRPIPADDLAGTAPMPNATRGDEHRGLL